MMLATASVSHQLVAATTEPSKSSPVVKICPDTAPAVPSAVGGRSAMSTNRTMPIGVWNVLVP